MSTLGLAAENFLWLASALALAAFGAAAVTRWVTATGRWTPSPHTLAFMYGGAVMAPPLVAAWVVLAALLPLLSLGDAFPGAHAWASHDDHLFSGVLHAFQPAAQRLAGAAFIVLMIGAVFATVSAAWQARRALRVLGATGPGQRAATRSSRTPRIRVLRARTDFPVCLVWGVRHPRIVVSDGLLAALRPRELRAVLEHESAHVSRHDNLAKLILGACAHATLVWPLSRRVLRWHAEQVELICDESAAARTRSPLTLAHALVAVHRRAQAAIVPNTATLVSSEKGSLERRVRRLLAFAGADARRPARSNTRFATTALNVMGLFAVTLAMVYFVAPLGVHALAELVLHRLQ